MPFYDHFRGDFNAAGEATVETTGRGEANEPRAIKDHPPNSPAVTADGETGVVTSVPVARSRETPVRGEFRAPGTGVLAVGAILCACAGMVNVIAFLVLGTFVSHVSGTTSHVGIRLQVMAARGLRAEVDVARAVCTLLSFIAGACLCGLLAGRSLTREVEIGKNVYGIACLVNAALLVASMLTSDYACAAYLCAAACGLQNGMCTMHFGSIVRTTHVTGLATDLGTNLGSWIQLRVRLSTEPSDIAELHVITEKLKVFLLLGFSFVFGSFLGASFVDIMHVRAFLVPAGLSASIGCFYLTLKTRLRHRALRGRGLDPTTTRQCSEMHRSMQQTVAFLDEAQLRGTSEIELRHLLSMAQHIEMKVRERYPNQSALS